MSWQLVVAGVLAAVATVWHLAHGERIIVPALRAAGVAPVTLAYVRVTWHLVTATSAVTAAWLVASGLAGSARGALLVALVYAAYAVVVVALALRTPSRLIRAPQWTVFLVIAALSARGAT